ncbi:MAG: C40 family peptidase [Fluviibacter phosphoraccumulans]
MTTRQEIVDCARGYLGVRWRHQGRSANGLDCIGLVVRVAHDLGLSTDDASDYGRVAEGKRLQHEFDKRFVVVPKESAQPGDIILMAYYGNPQHVGLMTDIGIIHAMLGVRKVVEHRIDHVWNSRIIRTYKFTGIE